MKDDPAAALSERTVKAARSVRVLSSLSWPEGTVQAFLSSWRRGERELPVVQAPEISLEGPIEALDAIESDADRSDPLQAYVADTAASYASAARMLQDVGTPSFSIRSQGLYGSPADLLPGSTVSHHSAASALLDNTASLAAAGVLDERDVCLTPEAVQGRLEKAFAEFFGDRAPRVEIDPNLASKAAAGSRRVRLRAATCFTELDVTQLIEHEGFVHTATALNGRAQPVASCMRLSTPRTTFTQEGLATLAELATRSIDIARLRRLALRTLAIHHALEGADYLEVFEFFLEAGQSEDESAHSTMRVFRGGDVRGRICFTKDVVYLAGLFAVHTYLRKAIAESRPHLVRRLFTGRLALGDVMALAPAFDDGRLAEPRFVPRWATEIHRLAAYLAFSALTDRIDLSAVELEGTGQV